MTTLYSDLATLKAILGKTSTDQDAYLTQCLTSASRYIDAVTGRRFYADSIASAREFRTRRRIYRDAVGEGLMVDDIADTTGMLVEQFSGDVYSTTDSTTYEFDPENAASRGLPVVSLYKPWGRWSWYRKVRVTAKWGWPSVPDAVVQATLLQSSRLYKRKDSPEGVIGGAEWTPVHMARVDPDVRALVQHLVIPGFG